MRKTSTIIALAIATILTAYISAPTLSNQAFAQQDEKGNIGSAAQGIGALGQTQAGQAALNTIHILGKALAGPEAQLGLNHILEGQQASVSHNLGCSPWDPRDC
jgi:hypothetical protein